jgi:histidinol phosphatase-like PHP family hydrolase
MTEKMKFKFDHDLHIHSQISLCSNDEGQTTENILEYAKKNGLSTIVLTDHYWDETVPTNFGWYQEQNFEHISKALPLPQAEGVEFLFGCESDMGYDLKIGISKPDFDNFDFVVIPTTHMHLVGPIISEEDASTIEKKAKAWVNRLDALLEMDIPFHKIGVAHLVCPLIELDGEKYLQFLDILPTFEMERLFQKAAEKGVGIELNYADMDFKTERHQNSILRIFRIAKEQGCKFYCASDAHHPQDFVRVKEVLERAIDLLDLKESDKFIIKRK